MDQLKSLSKDELNQNVKMKSFDNQWIVSKIINSSSNQIQIIYWNTSLSRDDDNSSRSNNTNSSDHHPNSPLNCYLIDINKCIINDDNNNNLQQQQTERVTIADINHIHLLYPSASSFSTLKPHRPFYYNQSSRNNQQQEQENNDPTTRYNNPFMPCSLNKNILSRNKKQSLLGQNDEFNDENDVSFDDMNDNHNRSVTLDNSDFLDDTVLCPMFPSSTSRSITSISGVLFLSSDHKTLYVMPHDHVTTVRHQINAKLSPSDDNDDDLSDSPSNHFIYGPDRDIIYKIPLLTDSKHNEQITYSQILPQPRVGSHHAVKSHISDKFFYYFLILFIIYPCTQI